MLKNLPRLAAVASLFVLFSMSAIAQVSGRLSGTVIDASGASIPNTRVALYIESTLITETKTNNDGIFSFPSIRSANYEVRVEASGFNSEILKEVKVDTARETSLPAITLQPAGVTATVDVSAAATTVQTSSAEISATVTNAQIARLPQLNRSPLALISTQAGVGSNGRENTTINGLRTSYTNVTIDGVNIQDNFIRTNALDFLPNRIALDQISEMTISTSNTSSSIGGAAGQISFTTPSGTNSYHGSLYWYNRNNALAANNWFNNRDRINLPFLNQNQVGGTLSGRIIKDKLFFYTNYEVLRLRQQTTLNRTILTESARNGIFTYQDTGGVTRQVNVLQAAGRQADPTVRQLISQLPPASAINNYRVGDSTDTLLRNTAGYSFLARSNSNRENLTTKIDWNVTSKLSAFGTLIRNSDFVDRPGISGATFTAVPFVSNDNKVWFGSYGFRWTPTATLTNEVRAGYNLAPGVFASTQANPSLLVGGLIFSNPVETFLPQGRFTDTYNFADNASWVKGKHSMTFGFQSQLTRVRSYNDAGIVPTYNLGISVNQTGLDPTALPGIRSNDVGPANNLLANLAGLLNTASATFNVKDRTSGYLLGQTNGRDYTFDTYAGYFQDTWKMNRRLTMNLGVRWEYFAPVNEANSLALAPQLIGNNTINTLLSNATLDFVGNSVGRPFYKKDFNNFAPNLSLAWDPFGNGRTVIRSGYSLNFVNDNVIRAVGNAGSTADGLSTGASITALRGTVSASDRPTIPSPAFAVPRTLQQNYNLNPSTAMAMVDPNLATPYVQQWSFSVQREIKGGVLDVRYIGNHSTKQYRGIDFNQVNINQSGFLADFNRAYANGIASQRAGGQFLPAYNANIPGSQPLTVFPLLGSGGNLTNATVVNNIQTQQVGSLADFYQQQALAGPRSSSPLSFYRNPFGLGMNLTVNSGNANYNALQVDYSRRYSRGLLWQVNYTWSKSLADNLGNGQTNFEAYLDINTPSNERARTPFDQTHSFKSNGVYELPFGPGKKFLGSTNNVVSRVVGGWSISGILTVASGNPFSILSERGTLNRGARSTGTNTANSNGLNKQQLDQLFGLRFTGGGPFFVAASAIGADGRGVATDGSAPFQGQAFVNPGAGTIGALQRRWFSGPMWSNLDFGIQKRTRITEKHSIELRLESTNALNQATFYYSDDFINSANFGKVNSTQTAARRIQLGLYYRF